MSWSWQLDLYCGLFLQELVELVTKDGNEQGFKSGGRECKLNIRMCPNSELEHALLQSGFEERAVGLGVPAEGFPPGAPFQCSTTGLLPPVQRAIL